MAGKSEVCNLIHKWMLDYIVYKIWDEFKETGKVSLTSVDLIAGVFDLPLGSDQTSLSKKEFLTVLCRINDGPSFDNAYSETSKGTVLEDMLPIFESLVRKQPKNICEDGLDLLKTIKKEAVSVCCRGKDFETATAVFKRQWSSEDRSQKQTGEMYNVLKMFIENKVSQGIPTYANFVKAMTKYLQSIFNRFKEPILVYAAENILVQAKKLTHVQESGDGHNTSQKRRFLCNTIQLAATVNTDDDEGQSGTTPRKQRKLFNNTLNQMFGEDGGQHEGGSQYMVTQEHPDSSTNSAPHKESPRRRNTSPTKSKPQQKSSHQTRRDASQQSRQPDSGNEDPAVENFSGSSPQAQHSTTRKEQQSNQRKIDVTKSPAYKKNIGRKNRHDQTNNQGERTQNADDISIISGESVNVSKNGSRKRWTEEEMEEFYDAVKTIGVGKWTQVKDFLNTSRTGVMLKDKWRTMTNSGDLERLEARAKNKRK